MKIRNGFVSNSSSCSFVLRYPLEDFNKEEFTVEELKRLYPMREDTMVSKLKREEVYVFLWSMLEKVYRMKNEEEDFSYYFDNPSDYVGYEEEGDKVKVEITISPGDHPSFISYELAEFLEDNAEELFKENPDIKGERE